MNLRNKKIKKWLLCFNYNPYNSLLEHHRNEIQAQLNIFCEKYEHLLIMGDFSSNISESTVIIVLHSIMDKIFVHFLRFDKISVYHKWIWTRLLSLKGECASCLRKLPNDLRIDLSKLANFNKIPEKFKTDGKSSVGHSKAKFWQLCWKIVKISVIKHSKETPTLPNFVNLSTIFCPWLSQKTYSHF